MVRYRRVYYIRCRRKVHMHLLFLRVHQRSDVRAILLNTHHRLQALFLPCRPLYFLPIWAFSFIRPTDPTVNDSCFFRALSCSICASTRNFLPGEHELPSLSRKISFWLRLPRGGSTTPLGVIRGTNKRKCPYFGPMFHISFSLRTYFPLEHP